MSMLDKWRLVQAAERACREDPSWTELSASAAAVRRSGGRARMQSLAPSVPLAPTGSGSREPLQLLHGRHVHSQGPTLAQAFGSLNAR